MEPVGLVQSIFGSRESGTVMPRSIITKILGVKLHIETDYTTFGKIQYILAQRELKILDTVYTDKVELEVLIPKTDAGTGDACNYGRDERAGRYDTEVKSVIMQRLMGCQQFWKNYYNSNKYI